MWRIGWSINLPVFHQLHSKRPGNPYAPGRIYTPEPQLVNKASGFIGSGGREGVGAT